MPDSTPSPRSRRRQQRTLDIIERATALLLEHGLDALTLQRLADELDLTPAALYRYFDSKDAILLAVQAHALDAFDQALEEAHLTALRERPDDPIHDLLTQAHALIHLTAQDPTRFALLATTITDPRVFVPHGDPAPILAPFLRTLHRLNQPLLRAQERGLLLPAPHDAPLRRPVALAASLMGVLTLRKVQRLNPDLLRVEPLALETLHALLRGWGCPPERLLHTHTPTPEATP